MAPHQGTMVLEALIGPFQTSALSIIPKSIKPGKCRLIQNWSRPHSPPKHISPTNSYIISELYPYTWGTFGTIALIIERLPPDSETAVRDVKEAYRTVPPPLLAMVRIAVIVEDLHAYSDANSVIGIRIVIGERWRTWRLVPGWNSHEIWKRHQLGRSHWLPSPGYDNRRPVTFWRPLQNFSDNMGVIKRWWRGCSCSRQTNEIPLVNEVCTHSSTHPPPSTPDTVQHHRHTL